MYKSTDMELRPASPSDRRIIDSLLQLYLTDMASDRPFAIGPDGKYEYGLMDAFWQHPYLFYVSNQIAGFALVISHCPITGKSPCWFMAEFFVMRGFRRQSIGSTMLHKVLLRHSGRWHIASQTVNSQADAFWAAAIGADSQDTLNVRFDDADWVVRPFESKVDDGPTH